MSEQDPGFVTVFTSESLKRLVLTMGQVVYVVDIDQFLIYDPELKDRWAAIDPPPPAGRATVADTEEQRAGDTEGAS